MWTLLCKITLDVRCKKDFFILPVILFQKSTPHTLLKVVTSVGAIAKVSIFSDELRIDFPKKQIAKTENDILVNYSPISL